MADTNLMDLHAQIQHKYAWLKEQNLDAHARDFYQLRLQKNKLTNLNAVEFENKALEQYLQWHCTLGSYLPLSLRYGAHSCSSIYSAIGGDRGHSMN